MNLELTGNFFVVTAALILLRSRMLLSKQERSVDNTNEEELLEKDPRWELVQQLLESKKIKKETKQIGNLMEGRFDYLPRIQQNIQMQDRN